MSEEADPQPAMAAQGPAESSAKQQAQKLQAAMELHSPEARL